MPLREFYRWSPSASRPAAACAHRPIAGLIECGGRQECAVRAEHPHLVVSVRAFRVASASHDPHTLSRRLCVSARDPTSIPRLLSHNVYAHFVETIRRLSFYRTLVRGPETRQ